MYEQIRQRAQGALWGTEHRQNKNSSPHQLRTLRVSQVGVLIIKVECILKIFSLHWRHLTRGVATGVYGYIPPKSVQVNFLWGRNDVRMTIEHACWRFIPPQNILYPQNKFLATPLHLTIAMFVKPSLIIYLIPNTEHITAVDRSKIF